MRYEGETTREKPAWRKEVLVASNAESFMKQINASQNNKLGPLNDSSWFRWHVLGGHDVGGAHFRAGTGFAFRKEREELDYSLLGVEVVIGE